MSSLIVEFKVKPVSHLLANHCSMVIYKEYVNRLMDHKTRKNSHP